MLIILINVHIYLISRGDPFIALTYLCQRKILIHAALNMEIESRGCIESSLA